MRTIPAMIAAMLLGATAVAAEAPRRTTVLTGKGMGEVLRQCSRGAPGPGQAWFRPTPAQIATLDRVAARRSGTADIARSHAVEVVGIVRGGRRFVYGNYYPLRMQEGVKEAPVHPTIVCDGGRQFFGIEIDAATGTATHVAFNGSI